MKLNKDELAYVFNIKKEIDFILKECGNDISYALNIERKRKAIFLSIINIKEALQKLVGKNKSVAIFFNKVNIKRLSASRNFIAHFNEKLNLKKIENLIKFDLVEIRKSILNIARKAENIELTKKANVLETKLKFWLAWTIQVAYMVVVYLLFSVLAFLHYGFSWQFIIVFVILSFLYLCFVISLIFKKHNRDSNNTLSNNDDDFVSYHNIQGIDTYDYIRGGSSLPVKLD